MSNGEPWKPHSLAKSWWLGLQPDPETGYPGDKATLARLRRADPSSAMVEEGALALFHRLGWRNPSRLPRATTLAHVLSHVRTDTEIRFGAAIGRASITDKDSAILKPLRFERLMNADTEEELARSFRRAVDILGNTANVSDLSRIILFWDVEDTRRRLAFTYFGAGAAAPASPDYAATTTATATAN